MSAPAITEHRRGGMVWFAAEHLERCGVRHGFTSRSGGASRGAFSSLNFSSREGDVPQRVLENWGRLETAATLPKAGWLCSRKCTARGSNELPTAVPPAITGATMPRPTDWQQAPEVSSWAC